MSGPRISCLMVTKDRLARVKRSIRMYCRQTWQNKELVVVSDGSGEFTAAIQAYVEGLGRDDIRCRFVSAMSSLGCLRNLSMDVSSGEVICQWDDDDLYHPRRLEMQYRSMTEGEAEACFFYDQLHYFEDSGELFWTDWSAQRGPIPDQGAPGTLLCRRDLPFRYPEAGEHSRRGEDSIVQEQLYKRSKVAGLRGMGYLYAYVYHGLNTWDRTHHGRVARWLAYPSSKVRAHLDDLALSIPAYFPVVVRAVSCADGRAVEIPRRGEYELLENPD